MSGWHKYGEAVNRTPEYTQATMPAASSVPNGYEVFNTTYKVKMRSDGTKWISLGPIVVYAAAPGDSVTGTTSLTALRSVLIPGGLVGENGKVLVEPVLTYTSNANAKNPSIRIGQTSNVNLSTTLWTHAQSNSSTSVFPYRFQNSGSQAAQIGGTSGATNASVGQSAVAAPPTAAVDTAQDWYLFLAATPASAGDTVGLAALTVTITPKWS